MVSKADTRLTLPDGGQNLPLQVNVGVVALREGPRPDAEMASQALYGETVRLHHEEGEFGLVQADQDGYVGWALMEALSAPVLTPTHRMSVPRAHVYAAPSIRAAPHFVVGIGAQVIATGQTEGPYVACARGTWIHHSALAPIDTLEADPASVAQRFITTPYLWGGRDCLGIDCSGLIQIAFGACGIAAPRDSDMQFAWLGEAIEDWSEPRALKRNDMVFWKGHVGIMLDAERFLHANAYHMAVAEEPLGQAITRIAKTYGEPIGARRVSLESAKTGATWQPD